MPELVPVDHNPFAPMPKLLKVDSLPTGSPLGLEMTGAGVPTKAAAKPDLVPVEHNPFMEKLSREVAFQRDGNVRRFGENRIDDNDERPVLDQNESLYRFKTGNKEGHIIIEPQENDKHLHVRWIGSGEDSGKPNSMGLSAIRGLREAIMNEFTQAETIGGALTAGARGSLEKQVDVRIPLKERIRGLVPVEHNPFKGT